MARSRRSDLGQFFTPASVARFMAGLLDARQPHIRLLDAGAGVGALTDAAVAELCARASRPLSIAATAYEFDESLTPTIRDSLAACGDRCAQAGVRWAAALRTEDFIAAAAAMLDGGLFPRHAERYTAAILNPPYKKLTSGSAHRALLRRAGIETSNQYTAFLALAVLLLEPGGELVAITPRSFCNGPYFRPFRELLLSEMALTHLHVYDARDVAFGGDDVLQENVIFRAVKTKARPATVTMSRSLGPDDPPSQRSVPYDRLVQPGDPERFIHVVPDKDADDVARVMRALPCTLGDLGIQVSTGRVVDFRAREHLRKDAGAECAPLIYPGHIEDGFIGWPRAGFKKPNAIARCPETAALLVPRGTYVVVKRFSSKEERRRVVAAVYDPDRIDADHVGFENHVNVYHQGGRGLDPVLARGLSGFLNCTLLDDYFRQWSGHTQVNATDLRNMAYPSFERLAALGVALGDRLPSQDALDALVDRWVRR